MLDHLKGDKEEHQDACEVFEQIELFPRNRKHAQVFKNIVPSPHGANLPVPSILRGVDVEIPIDADLNQSDSCCIGTVETADTR